MVILLNPLRLISWCLAALMTASLVAQSSPQVGPAAKKARAASPPPWRQMTIRFSDEKVILGLPQESDRSVTYCSDAGTTIVDLYGASSLSGSASIPELFRHLAERRSEESAPDDALRFHRRVSIRDFFAADRTLVTLVEAMKRDDHGDTSVQAADHLINGVFRKLRPATE